MFTDDFVPNVPLPAWGFSKYGEVIAATAETLYESNNGFRTQMNSYIASSSNIPLFPLSLQRNVPVFDANATRELLIHYETLAPTIEQYFEDPHVHYRSPNNFLIVESMTVYQFMNRVAAAVPGVEGWYSGVEFILGINASPISYLRDYFVRFDLINSTHQAFTYRAALMHGGFPLPADGGGSLR